MIARIVLGCLFIIWHLVFFLRKNLYFLFLHLCRVMREFIFWRRTRRWMVSSGHEIRDKKLISLFRFVFWLCLQFRRILQWRLFNFLHLDDDVVIFLAPIAICLLTDAVLAEIDLVDGFGSGIVDPCLLGCLRNIHTLLVNEGNQLLSFGVWYRFVFFAHWWFSCWK